MIKKYILIFIFIFGFVTQAIATNYYINPAATGTGTGLNNTDAWTTLSAITGMSEGDDLYLICGATFDQQRIYPTPTNGTDVNPAIIGAYYMSGGAGTETVGVNGDGKPIIQGTINHLDYRNDNYPNYPGGTNGDPSYGAAIFVSEAYVTIQDIHIKNSGCYGVRSQPGTGNRMTVQRVRLENIFKHGISASGWYNLISHNWATELNSSLWNVCDDSSDHPTWGGGFEIGDWSTVSSNLIDGYGGEGIIARDNCLVTENVLTDGNSVAIYVDGGDSVEITYNLIVGLDSASLTNDCWGSNGWDARGIEIDTENRSGNTNTIDLEIHHNIVINSYGGIRLLNNDNDASWDYVYIYNNLLIDNYWNFSAATDIGYPTTNLEDISDKHVEFKNNNSIVARSDTTTHGVLFGAEGFNPATWIFDNNNFYGGVIPTSNPSGYMTNQEWLGTNSTNINPVLGKSGTWRGTITGLSDLTNADFITGTFIPGVDLGLLYDDFIDPNTMDWIITDPTVAGGEVTINTVTAGSTAWVVGPIANVDTSTTYYVDATSGLDTNTGLSHAQAWKTLEKVNSTVTAAGSDVYLLCGETWSRTAFPSDQVWIKNDWGGVNATNYAIIGAYYMTGGAGTETVGVNGDGKPIIQGVLDDITPANNYPAKGSFIPQIDLTEAYSIVQDLDLRDAGEYGVRVTGNADNFKVQRIVTDGTYRGGIFVSSNMANGFLEYNFIQDAGHLYLDTGSFPGALYFRHADNVVARYNYVKGSYGEGISWGDNSIVMYNIAQDCFSVHFYNDGGTNNEVAYNLALGTTDTTYMHGGSWAARGFEVSLEPVSDNSYNISNIRIHHNTAINCGTGYRWINQGGSDGLRTADYVYFYNNIAIDCQYSFKLHGNNGSDNYDLGDNLFIFNNTSYPKAATTFHAAVYNTLPAYNDTNINFNNWTVDTAPTGIWAGVDDPTPVDPGFSKTGDWIGTITDLSSLTNTHMTPTAFATGTDLGGLYHNFINPVSMDWIITDPSVTAGAVDIDLVTAENYSWVMGPIANVDTGTSYYVNPAANGTDTGLSNENAFRTLAAIPALTTGDDVYLICGATFTAQRMTIDWGGTASNRAVFGAYYMAGGVGTETVGVNGDGKPIIDGNNVTPAYNPTDLAYQFTQGLLAVNSSEGGYITIQDIVVKNSPQHGINVGNTNQYMIVQRVDVTNTGGGNIRMNYGCEYSVLDQLELSYGGTERIDWFNGKCFGWAVGGATVGKKSIIKNSLVYNSYGEGIALGDGSSALNNVVGDTMSVGIYVNGGKDTEIAYNVIFGTDLTDFNQFSSCSTYPGSQSDWKGVGIATAIERYNYPSLEDVKVHHNIVINRTAGLRTYNSNETSVIVSGYWYNNILIDNQYSMWPSSSTTYFAGGSLSATSEFIVRNNLSYPNHADAGHTFTNDATTYFTNWTVDHNAWTIKTAPTNLWAGTGDVLTDPAFTKAIWKGTMPDHDTAISLITAANLYPNAGSEGLGTTLPVWAEFGMTLDTNHTTTDPVTDPIIVQLVTHPDPPDIGAFVSGDTPTIPPDPGTGNVWTGDPRVIAVWNHDSGALTTDSKGIFTLTNVGVTEGTTYEQQGDANGIYTHTQVDYQHVSNTALDAITDFTIAGWVTFSSVANQYVWSKYMPTGDQRSWDVKMDATGHMKTGVSTDGTIGNLSTYTHGTILAINTPYHIMTVHNLVTGYYKIRILDTSFNVVGTTLEGTHIGGIFQGTSAVVLGESNLFSGTYAFNGTLDEIVLADEVKDNAWQDAVAAQSYGTGTGPTITSVGRMLDPDGTPAFSAAASETWNTIGGSYYPALTLSEQIVVTLNPDDMELALILSTGGTRQAQFYGQINISTTYYLVFEYIGQADDYSADLNTDVVATALALNGASLIDGDGNYLTTTLSGTDLGSIVVDMPPEQTITLGSPTGFSILGPETDSSLYGPPVIY